MLSDYGKILLLIHRLKRINFIFTFSLLLSGKRDNSLCWSKPTRWIFKLSQHLSVGVLNCDYCWKTLPESNLVNLSTLRHLIGAMRRHDIDMTNKKTLSEAQRTQGIESLAWIMFLTEINLKCQFHETTFSHKITLSHEITFSRKTTFSH